jgi:hypothetical protein
MWMRASTEMKAYAGHTNESGEMDAEVIVYCSADSGDALEVMRLHHVWCLSDSHHTYCRRVS